MAPFFRPLQQVFLILLGYSTNSHSIPPKCTAIDGVNKADFGNGFDQRREDTTLFNDSSICQFSPDDDQYCSGWTQTGYFYGYHDLTLYDTNTVSFDANALGSAVDIQVSYDCVGTANWIPLTVASETRVTQPRSDGQHYTIFDRTYILPSICDLNPSVGIRFDHEGWVHTAMKNVCLNFVVTGVVTPTAATLSPTRNPSLVPTLSPITSSPTRNPASAPTIAPLSVASLAPSATPTLAPLISPTMSPSRMPSSVPSLTPTLAPTDAPSLTTGAPSPPPTNAWSIAPSIAPTLAPLISSFTPTNTPSVPSLTPTLAPTHAPSLTTDAPSLTTDAPSLTTDAPSPPPTNINAWSIAPSSSPTPMCHFAKYKSEMVRSDLLNRNDFLYGTQSLVSKNCRFLLTMQANGNLILEGLVGKFNDPYEKDLFGRYTHTVEDSRTWYSAFNEEYWYNGWTTNTTINIADHDHLGQFAPKLMLHAQAGLIVYEEIYENVLWKSSEKEMDALRQDTHSLILRITDEGCLVLNTFDNGTVLGMDNAIWKICPKYTAKGDISSDESYENTIPIHTTANDDRTGDRTDDSNGFKITAVSFWTGMLLCLVLTVCTGFLAVMRYWKYRKDNIFENNMVISSSSIDIKHGCEGSVVYRGGDTETTKQLDLWANQATKDVPMKHRNASNISNVQFMGQLPKFNVINV